MTRLSVRPATHAGTFYPGNADELRNDVEEYISSAQIIKPAQKPLGFISPHAGYAYSGATAGHVYAHLRELSPEVVFIVSPSHHAAFDLPSVWDGPAYATPLGECRIDSKVVAALREEMPGMKCEHWADVQEHSLEVQVPFLQVACPKARLVPLVIGAQQIGLNEILAAALINTLDKCDLCERGRAAIIASSDGYHGYNMQNLKSSDAQLANAICAMDPAAVYAPSPSGDPMACGRAPIAVLMHIAKRLGADQVTILKQSTSADVVPHREGQWAVGYLAAMLS